MPLSDDGLDIDALEYALAETGGPSLVYTIPTFQNPSGRTLGAEPPPPDRGGPRATRSSSRTTRTGCFASEARACRACSNCAGGEGAMLLSSFSKTVAPGIRVGFAILPEEPWAPCRRSSSRTTSRR